MGVPRQEAKKLRWGPGTSPLKKKEKNEVGRDASQKRKALLREVEEGRGLSYPRIQKGKTLKGNFLSLKISDQDFRNLFGMCGEMGKGKSIQP